jgi:hypothetical protein
MPQAFAWFADRVLADATETFEGAHAVVAGSAVVLGVLLLEGLGALAAAVQDASGFRGALCADAVNPRFLFFLSY